ncbi:hypothetical protein BTO06_11170 [Tenacibaculum sp. SZ-18]|uniref:hypothetical protein n=1 Tax=Tenacibaculum sp. SZ-18 TaxID=754423 RepID=UPI000C2D572C|nr:hypothetical protein [Tenacibaculum sp. SZ-18]AUC15671.1 hypothetical protein BTO06_11170 [Tenacibaculum sp. SZ-18]
MNARIKIIASFLILYFCIQDIVAQKVIAKEGNKIEYKDDEIELDDMNSISAPSNTVVISGSSKNKTKKKATNKKIASVKKVEKLMKQKKRLRFRSKRTLESKKCFKTAKKPCDTKKQNKN